jgi:hypothetical protein
MLWIIVPRRDGAQRQRVAHLDVGLAAEIIDWSPTLQAVRAQDVPLLAVGVVEQRDARRCGWGRTRWWR